MRITRHFSEESREQRELDAPGWLWRAIDMMLEEGASQRGACKRRTEAVSPLSR